MSKLERALFCIEDIRRCERLAIEHGGLSPDDLMLRAGTAAWTTLKTLYPDIRTIAVYCGAGNNAGDGYVLARLAHSEGFYVIIYAVKSVDDLPPTAKSAAIKAIEAGVLCHSIEDALESDIELVVDALLGIGLQGPVQEPYVHAIHLINDSELPVLAIDIPSGLNANTGTIQGVCINAAVTITFIAPKIGLYTLDGPDQSGKIVCHHLQLLPYLENIQPAAYQLDKHLLHGLMRPRLKNSHKGSYGHVLIIGGGTGMPGAPYLAALAALRTGAGMVTVATLPAHVDYLSAFLPEALVYAVQDVDSLLPLLAKATVCVIGPGLGEDPWAQSLFDAAIAVQLPLVIDASALRMLAHHPQHDDNWVLTPHPAEAASLLACSVADIQRDRCVSAARIQQQYGGVVVLKGCGSIVHTGAPGSYICTAGNPGMATAGLGDVLSGLIAALLAQGVPIEEASQLGVWLHAKAADEAVATQGERGLIASDLMPYLRRLINQCT